VVLLLGRLLQLGCGYGFNLLLMTDYERSGLVIAAIMAVIMLALGPVVIPRFGIVGAAAVTIGAGIIGFGTAAVVARRKLGINPTVLSRP
jgi:O-antigen/teichoic acid export membrane protein